MTTGDKIRGIRLLKELSQENMAEMLNISRQSYGDIERGKTDINDSRLKQIAEVLGVTTSDILGFGERINCFFEHSSGGTGINNGVQNHYYTSKELIHEIEKLKLEVEKLKIEKEKAEFEVKYWREKCT